MADANLNPWMILHLIVKIFIGNNNKGYNETS